MPNKSIDWGATLNHATDLLHAHQIRRENLFLHKELEACRRKLVALTDEVKQFRSICQSSNDSAEAAQRAVASYQTQMHHQELMVTRMLESNESFRSDFMQLVKQCDQSRHNEQVRHAELERKIEELTDTTHRALEAQPKDDEKLTHLMNTLRAAEQRKAESAFDLIDQLNSIGRVSRAVSASTSCIVESIERCEPITSNAPEAIQKSISHAIRNTASLSNVQIPDSQSLDAEHIDRGRKASTIIPEAGVDRCCLTIPEDVDLDSNVPSFGYEGYRQFGAELENNEGSLVMLPELPLQASKLAKINMLKQGRYETWETYYSKGQSLRAELPYAFEGVIVGQFVDGMAADAQKTQCRKWLDKQGWSWQNIISFADLCSQVDMRRLSFAGEISNGATNITSLRRDPTTQKQSHQIYEAIRKPDKALKSILPSRSGPGALRRSQRLIDRTRRQRENNTDFLSQAIYSGLAGKTGSTGRAAQTQVRSPNPSIPQANSHGLLVALNY